MQASGLVAGHAAPNPAASVLRPPRHVAAAGLVGSALADRYCFWRGRSGRRYIFSVYHAADVDDPASSPCYEGAVVIHAERRSDGTRRIVRVGQTGGLAELLVEERRFDSHASANEVHVHLLAGTANERRSVLQDLCGAH